MLFATVMSGCGTDIEPGSESQPDSSQTDSSSLSESQDVETPTTACHIYEIR